MGQQEHDHHDDSRGAREQARPASPDLAPDVRRALGAHGVLPPAFVTAHPEQKGDGEGGEDHGLGDGHGHVAVQLGRVDVEAEKAESPGEDERRAEGIHGRHEDQERCPHQGRRQQGQGDRPEAEPGRRAQVAGRLHDRGIDAPERRRREEVEEDVHGVAVDEQHGPHSVQRKGRALQSQRRLDEARDHAAFAVEKQEGEHAHQGRQDDGQRGQRREDGPAGKVVVGEDEGQGHADQGREQHAAHGDHDAVEETFHVGRVFGIEELPVVAEAELSLAKEAFPQDERGGIHDVAEEDESQQDEDESAGLPDDGGQDAGLPDGGLQGHGPVQSLRTIAWSPGMRTRTASPG